jgi:hypothetical protein
MLSSMALQTSQLSQYKRQLCYTLGITAEAVLALYPVIISALGKITAGSDLLE